MTTTSTGPDREWVHEAIRIVEADQNRSADTHLLVFPLPTSWNLDLYLKDESVHPTGSLKHRLARSLFLYALCNGTSAEAPRSSRRPRGSTAVSEAYFARCSGLPFVAVMPRTTSREKIDLIEFHGGRCHLVDDPARSTRRPAARGERGGHYMDQFTYAERATDWRGNNNIAESIFEQMPRSGTRSRAGSCWAPAPAAQSATIGRYVRYKRHATLCASWTRRAASPGQLGRRSPGEGALRVQDRGDRPPRVEPSFVGTVVDAMIRVPDAASVAAMRWTSGCSAAPSVGRRAPPCGAPWA
jgi:cysteine synthase A